MSEKAEGEFNLDEDLVIELSKPIDGPDGPVSRLIIREPTADEWEQWDALKGIEADIKAISIVAGVPLSVVRKLPARPFVKASRRIGAFLL